MEFTTEILLLIRDVLFIYFVNLIAFAHPARMVCLVFSVKKYLNFIFAAVYFVKNQDIGYFDFTKSFKRTPDEEEWRQKQLLCQTAFEQFPYDAGLFHALLCLVSILYMLESIDEKPLKLRRNNEAFESERQFRKLYFVISILFIGRKNHFLIYISS